MKLSVFFLTNKEKSYEKTLLLTILLSTILSLHLFISPIEALASEGIDNQKTVDELLQTYQRESLYIINNIKDPLSCKEKINEIQDHIVTLLNKQGVKAYSIKKLLIKT